MITLKNFGAHFTFRSGWTVSLVNGNSTESSAIHDIRIWNSSMDSVLFGTTPNDNEILGLSTESVCDVLQTVASFAKDTSLDDAAALLSVVVDGKADNVKAMPNLAVEAPVDPGRYVRLEETDGDVFNLESFRDLVTRFELTDSEGFLKPAKRINGHVYILEERIPPSKLDELLPGDATSIVWYETTKNLPRRRPVLTGK